MHRHTASFDLIVIGAGSGGLSVSLGLLELGLKVLMIDKSDWHIGGECLNTGCVPSKALIHISRLIQQGKNAQPFGYQLDGKTDMLAVKQYISEKQQSIKAHENTAFLRKQGLNIVLGTAHFVEKDTLEVEGKCYKGKNIVIATGSSPRKLDVVGLEKHKVFTNENIFELDYLPENFLFVGAGPNSIELGQAFARLGSKVTIVDRGEKILSKDDPAITHVLQQQLIQENITFFFNSEIENFSQSEAIIKNKNGDTSSVPVDAVFTGIGRILNFEDLHLQNAGVKTKEGKIQVNDRLQTTNPQVFVCGDAAGSLKFSHAAELHATVLINNFLSPFKKKLELKHFPWVTFADPEVATFGLNEGQLKKKNTAYERLEMDFQEDDRATTDNYQYGKLILFVEKKRFNIGAAKILGGSMVAPHAGEMTQELILANTTGMPIKEIFNKVYAYPTSGRVNKKIILERYRKLVKPWLHLIIRVLYRF